MTDALVKDFYTKKVRDEWRRLVKDAYHRLEFDTTLHYLDKYLPPHGLILDAGGGPGRYTLELAKKGYEVVLLGCNPGQPGIRKTTNEASWCYEKGEGDFYRLHRGPLRNLILLRLRLSYAAADRSPIS